MPSKLAMLWILTLATLAGAADVDPRWRALVSPAGRISLYYKERAVGSLECGLYEAVWRSAAMSPGRVGSSRPTDGVLRSQIRAPGGAVVETQLRLTRQAEGLLLHYQLTPREDVKLNSLHVSIAVPVNLLTGGAYVANEQRSQFPTEFRDVSLRAGSLRSLALVLSDGAELRFGFPEETPVLVQDDRQWSPNFSVRIGPQMGGASVWPAGKSLDLAFTLSAPGGIALEYDEPITIQAGRDWLPLDLELDVEAGSALDFTHIVPWHAPAGKLGRVVATAAGQFAFTEQPDQPVRFYGPNLCFSAQYLTHEQSDRLAERMRRLGYNAVRLHHYESLLVDRSQGTSTRLNPERLDQLDYLVHACKQRGIYTTTDLFVSRQVFAAELWPGESGDVGMDEFKMAVPVNERAFANYREFAKALLDHVNPYTRLRWAEEPAVAWLSLINEPNPGNFLGRLTPRLQRDYERAWKDWLAQQHPEAGDVPLPTSEGGNREHWLWVNVFLADNQRAFYVRAERLLREELGCQALLTNLNAWTNPVQMHSVRQIMDYVDDHFYVDHPEFLERPWRLPSRCPNTSPIAAGAPGGRNCAFLRVLDKPFTCSEFNYSGPGRFRGVGGILTGALGALQDWSVIWRFAYSHSRDNLFVPGAAGYFDMASDPLSQAADRASVCLFRRGDLRPAPHSVAIALTTQEAIGKPRSVRGVVPPWSSLAWITRVGSVITDQPASVAADLILPLGWETKAAAYGANAANVDPFAGDAGDRMLELLRQKGWLAADNVTELKTARLQSETGELTIDAPADVFTVDTPHTAGGYAPAGKTVTTRALTVEILDTPATVWVSSLTDRPIAESRRLLVTHLTDLQNTDARYADRERTVLLSWGSLPHLVRAGTAVVRLRLANSQAARVWSLASSGRRTGTVSCEVNNGELVIRLSIDGDGRARMLYEIELP